MEYCDKCGNQMDENASFCKGCGAPVAIQNSFENSTIQNVFRRTNNNKTLLIVAWIFLSPIMAIITIIRSKKLSMALKVVCISLIVIVVGGIIVVNTLQVQKEAETAFNQIEVIADKKDYILAETELEKYIVDYPNSAYIPKAESLLESVKAGADKIRAEQKAKADKLAAEQKAKEKLAQEKKDKKATEKALDALKNEPTIEQIVMCEIQIEKALKAPSTAKWQSASEWTFHKISDFNFTVYGYVDSQNSFGAMIRTDVSATYKAISKDNCLISKITVGDTTFNIN